MAEMSGPSPRVAALLAELTWAEKLAQLQGLWIGADTGGAIIAPEMDSAGPVGQFQEFAADGLGHVTRLYGTAPIPPSEGLERLLGYQRWIRDHTRVPIGLLIHEECLTGLAAWTATTYPTPLAWAATFDPALVRRMGAEIGATMAGLGVHQGLAPVVDVVRDARWGRVEETMGEDPYVVGTLGAAYIAGVESAGIIATAKHFLSYSASQSGRNLAPVHAGRREVADVFERPFEMAVRDGGARSVMPAYVDLDGEPLHASAHFLTDLLRGEWGFEGTVVSDYYAVEFLERQHHVAADLPGAGRAALAAGVDVELPTGVAYRTLVELAESDPELQGWIDRAVTRVLAQKEALGLLDLDAEIARLEALAPSLPETLDPPAHRATAAALAAESVILLTNEEATGSGTVATERALRATATGPDTVAAGNTTAAAKTLPLTPRANLRLAVIGPNADRQSALFGCYSFVNHVLEHNPGVPSRLAAPTVLEAIRAEYEPAGTTVTSAPGCPVRDADRSGFAAAVETAEQADVTIAVVGDQSALFGRGTSGEGCDADSLELPGVQGELLEALLATGRPVVVVALTGRPYALGRYAGRAAAIVQAFFPGEEGAQAVAGVLSGRLNPSGHLPVSVPNGLATLPFSYLHPQLAEANGVSPIDPTPQFYFGHGLGYADFELADLVTTTPTAPTDGWIELTARVTNTGERAGTCLAQLYGRDPVASLARPTVALLGYARVDLAAGAAATLRWRVPAARFAFAGRDLVRRVEPGEVRLWLGRDAGHPATDPVGVTLTGAAAPVGPATPRLVTCELSGATA
ncbi:MAG: glycoside hydrolase family 3 C-terminal domain-containing protein [Propionibacteriaceae bacterium]|jgi:beta-glucosidase|nr:glycoside hydrolase family 3 C-terminal domain-containing protein [Propionibacteriaceae bacterium]